MVIRATSGDAHDAKEDDMYIVDTYCNHCNDNTLHYEETSEDGVVIVCSDCGFWQEHPSIEHIDSEDCWCEPELEYYGDEAEVWVHNSRCAKEES